MKKLKLMLIGGLILSSTVFGAMHRDGTYRGNFLDKGENQVTLEFVLKDDVVTAAKYRGLTYRGTDYLKDERVKASKDEHTALLTHMIGKNINDSIDTLYHPEDIQLAGATMRSNKVRSAFQDGLNRGAYKLAK